MEPSDKCPECGSGDLFFHCHERCSSPTHAVTCIDCKTPFVTALNVRDYLKDDMLKSWEKVRARA